jgi:hypothetical protein
MREALALWRGPALADLAYEPFAQAAVGRLEELRLAALERRIDADLALGRHADLVAELEELVAQEPLRERLRAQLILALYRCGRQADALEVYQAARRTLAEELALEPSPALRELELAVLRQDPALELAHLPAPDRSILVAIGDDSRLGRLLALAEQLAKRPAKELILARPIGESDELASAARQLETERKALVGQGVPARAAAFTSPEPGQDVIRLAVEQDVDLVLLDGAGSLLEDRLVVTLLAGAPCDVAVLAGGIEERPGPVLVPFVGAEHDWAAVELGGWVAGAFGLPLVLAGPLDDQRGRDASRLLASASLAVQRSLGVSAEPLLLPPGGESLVAAAREARLVVLGLSVRWRTEGLGEARRAILAGAPGQVLLVRRGLRPGGLAPRETLTRFTWSLRGSG